MDNSGITHNANIAFQGRSMQTYVETGKIILDLNLAAVSPLKFDVEGAERLVRILQAAIADKES